MLDKSKYNIWHANMQNSDINDVLQLPWYKTVFDNLPNLNNLNVLEIGCGRGAFTLFLSKIFPIATITGVDFSDKAIQIACSRNPVKNKITFQVEDAQQLSFTDKLFDIVISCETIEHVISPTLMAKEIARVLKPHGRFYLTTENYFNGMILAWIKCWITNTPFDSGAGVQPHENFFVFWRIKRLLSSQGLLIESTYSNHFQWLLLPRISWTKLCTRKFKIAFLNRFFKPFGRHYTFVGYKK
jgi:SAM-dependent methyltransferase